MNAKAYILLAVMVSCATAWAGEATARTQVRKVALFKNGYNWVEMSATLPDARRVRLLDMPQALLGTVWWDAASGVRELEGSSEEIDSSVADYDYADLLAANAGRQVKIALRNDRLLEGKILPQLARKTAEDSFLKPLTASDPQAPKIILVETGDGVQCVTVTEVVWVDFSESPRLPVKKETSHRVTAQLERPNPGAAFRFGYVSGGMSWLPEYSLELGENGTAKLTCRANIINEMTELEDVELQLVSGFPSLGDALVGSPLNRAVKLADFLEKLGALTRESNSYLTRNSAVAAPAPMALYRKGGADESGADEPDSQQVEDLFYYSLPHFSCKRGESVLREIFSHDVPYEHVYTCRVPNQSELERRSRRGEPVADVWHCVRLTNAGRQAWSTGIATCTAGGRIAGRSTLYFAAPGAETLLRLNKSMQASVQCREVMVNREERDMVGTTRKKEVGVYQGVVTLKNDSDRAMELRLTKEVNGLVTQADKEGGIDVSPSYAGNPRSVITWKFIAQPGEESQLNYAYEYENN